MDETEKIVKTLLKVIGGIALVAVAGFAIIGVGIFAWIFL